MRRNQRLIAIEAIDGGGKSVQAALLQIGLERAGYSATITKAKNPGQNGTVKAFAETFDIKSDSMAFMFLYQALHRQQYERTMAAFAEGKVVIADRWDTSFFVYHGITGPLRRHSRMLGGLNRLAFEGLQPDLRFFIDVPVSVALERRIARGDIIASLDEEAQFYERVSAEYKRLFAGFPHHRIDGMLPIEDISHQMLSVALEHI